MLLNGMDKKIDETIDALDTMVQRLTHRLRSGH